MFNTVSNNRELTLFYAVCMLLNRYNEWAGTVQTLNDRFWSPNNKNRTEVDFFLDVDPPLQEGWQVKVVTKEEVKKKGNKKFKGDNGEEEPKEFKMKIKMIDREGEVMREQEKVVQKKPYFQTTGVAPRKKKKGAKKSTKKEEKKAKAKKEKKPKQQKAKQVKEISVKGKNQVKNKKAMAKKGMRD